VCGRELLRIEALAAGSRVACEFVAVVAGIAAPQLFARGLGTFGGRRWGLGRFRNRGFCVRGHRGHGVNAGAARAERNGLGRVVRLDEGEGADGDERDRGGCR
jgi:hypothetical protein